MKVLALLAALALFAPSASAQGFYNGTPGPDFLGPTDEHSDYYGNEGDDILVGGSGDDLLVGGSGSDVLFDDDGGDVFYADDCEHDIIYAIDDPNAEFPWYDSITADVLDTIYCDPNDIVTIYDCDGNRVFFGFGEEYYAWLQAQSDGDGGEG